MEDGSFSNFSSLVSSFTDFLTVAIHTILYERSIYPQSSFLTARKYNFPVRQSRHPKVCQWIQDAVAAAESEMLKCTVARVAIVIYSPLQQPLERFMFDLSKFPEIPLTEASTPFERTPTRQNSGKALNVDMEEQFRAVMSKLSVCGGLLKPIPTGCSFTVAIELKDKVDPPMGHPQPWIPVQPSLQVRKSHQDHDDPKDRKGADLGGAKVTPVRSVEAAELAFEMWIEEGRRQGEDESSAAS